jgi:hypothetical protein
MGQLLNNLKIRMILWILLLGLTISILLFPVSVSPTYPLPVQSIYIFSDLPLFTGLFYSWVLLLLLLLFSGWEHELEKLALCFVFTLIFLQFWTLISPWGRTGDGLWQMGHVRYISEHGKIPSGEHAGYFGFPGLHFLCVAIHKICGLDIFMTRTVFLLLNSFIFTTFLFLFFSKLLANASLASIGVIMAVTSSLLIGTGMNQFHPMSLATTYIGLFLLLLVLNQSGSRLFSNWQGSLIFLLVTVAATIEYLFTPFLFFFVLLSVYVFHRNEKEFVNLATVFIPLVFAIAWEIFWAISTFNSVVSAWPKILEDLKAGEFFVATERRLRENIGPSYPWWGNVTRLFWWSFVFGFGTLLTLSKLPSLEKKSHLEKVCVPGLVGVLLTIFIGTLGTRWAVHGGISRYLWVGSFFIVPGLIHLLTKRRIKKYGLIFLFLSLFLFTFPTFLTNMDTLCIYYVYPSDISVGKFIENIYDSGRGLKLYDGVLKFTYFYVWDAQKIYPPEPSYEKGLERGNVDKDERYLTRLFVST